MEKIENTNVGRWVDSLEKARSGPRNPKFVAYLLRLSTKPKRQRASVNLSKLDRLAKDSDSIIVPGKVLGSGNISKKIKVAAIDFSGSAAEKLVAAKCEIASIDELLADKSARIII